jgi:hypothetical protein
LLFLVLRSWQSQLDKSPLDADRAESLDIDEDKLAYYQKQVEQELAAEDPVFSRPRSEVD